MAAFYLRTIAGRGNQQTVEVRHVHIYPGAQGVVGIVNPSQGNGEAAK
jgi:hypothetical protein